MARDVLDGRDAGMLGAITQIRLDAARSSANSSNVEEINTRTR
jgi:hypothetical protein